MPNNEYSSDWTGTLNYDGNENLTGRVGWTYTCDAHNRLVAIDGGNVHIRQHYDPLNRIVARDTNGDITTNVWDNWNLIEERNSGDALRRLYFWGAGTNEIVASSGPAYGDLFYFQDGRGNVTHLADHTNTVVERYTYFVSGQPNTTYSTRPNLDNQFLFGGARYIREAQIYDMRNRFYHPNLGRFLQMDPIGFDAGDMNLYRYCGNDPVDGSDPTGLLDVNASLSNHLLWLQGGSILSSEQFDALKQGAARIVLELIPAGDRHISQAEVKKKDGTRALGLTEPDFKVRDPEKQQDGSWKVTGVYTLNVKYADGKGTKAGPKSLNHTYNEEWRHAVPFDRWFARSLKTVNEMNKAFHFESPWRARDALEAQLRPGYERAYDASLDIHKDGSQHNSPYKYEE